MDKIYDVIILGAGPGGLAAGLYSGRYRLSTLIIEKARDGGQIAITAVSYTHLSRTSFNAKANFL